MSLGGFVDLRIERRASAANDAGIWPSFTDIMMVIVMVFLLSLVVILLNNVRLQEVLQASLSTEQAAVAENLNLTDQLLAARDQLVLSEEQLAAARSQLDQRKSQLQSLRQRAEQLDQARKAAALEQTRLADLASNRAAQLAARVAELRAVQAETENLLSSQQTLRTQLDEVRGDLAEQQAESQQQISTLQAEVQRLQTGVREREQQITDLRETASISDEQLAALKQRYDELDSEYQALVGLARSDVGKYVAEVRFNKVAEQFIYSLKLPDEAAPQPLDRATLEQRLGALKAEQGDNLYIRIIIPDDSPLSHNEAWTFTQAMLNAYDYYHQQ